LDKTTAAIALKHLLELGQYKEQENEKDHF
jgi:hypothetical protein